MPVIGYARLEAFGNTITRELPELLTVETANDCLYAGSLAAAGR